MSTTLPATFTHLQVHSHYSLLGGTAPVAALANRAAAEGFTHLALTDTNALYGAVAFANACREAGIRPILGMAVDIAVPFADIRIQPEQRGRLVLLATEPAGYRSLCRLSSLLQCEADRSFLLDWETLKAQREGLLCLEGGRRGWLAHYLRAGNQHAATHYVSRLGAIFQENCYLSIELHQPEDRDVARQVASLGQRFGLPPVAVHPIYVLHPEDAPRLRLLAAIDHNCALEMVPPTALPAGEDPGVDLHWLTAVEMAERYAEFPEALAAVGAIVKRCGPVLPDGRPIWPVLSLPDEQTADEALILQAQAGLAEKYGADVDLAIQERLQMELDAIDGHGFAPLFLVVADVVRFARLTEIPVSTRGSVANSLVAYCLGITTVDPIAHNLIFERFLNPARANLPDIDLDFCSRRRDEVLNYVRRTYGDDRVALVATVSTLRPKSAVRETAKAYGLDEAQIKKLAALIPREWHPDPRRRNRHSVDDILAQLQDERAREVVEAAYGIIGQPHHLSIHPGGVVITPGPLTDVVAVQLAPKGFLITQYDHRDLETIGLPKLDLLGIRALTVLADSAELVRAHYDPDFRLFDIPLDDPQTGDLLARGDSIGVFQCDSEGARRTLRQLQARTVQDLAVANAFFKPGPATGGMARSFIRRYRGEEAVTFLHPALAPILGSTQGVLLFQEQVLRVAREIAGLSWEQADYLRRGMSKIRAQEMAAMRLLFIQGCQRPLPEGPDFTAQEAETLWEQVIAFAGYGFNQGHATAYADVSYRSAYLKAHWPAAFLCARLANEGGFHHPAVYMAEARRLGIEIRPPHVNHSLRSVTLSFEARPGEAAVPVLWMGLGAVRNLRRASVRKIIGQRARGPFGTLRDLMSRVSLRKKEIKHLIYCGALDGLGESRAALLAAAERMGRAGNAHQLAFDFAQETAVAPETPGERLQWEKHILGLPLSIHPLALPGAVDADLAATATPLRQVPARPNEPVTVVAVRLPGWPGGKGFFAGDGDDFVIVKVDRAAPAHKVKVPYWRPLRLNGRWRSDEWGHGWFQANEIDIL